MSERHRITTERAREIGRMGRKASPWNDEPACNTPRAIRLHAQHKRMRLIEDAAKKNKAKEPT